MFEHTELFARTSGDTSDVVTKEMYTFEDKGGRSLTLRPESTASGRARLPDTRAGAAEPVQGATTSRSEFRHGRPQAGRLREFRQFGIEVIGVEGAAADVEVIVLGERYLRERGLAPVRPAPELDRRRELPPRVPRAARRLLRAVSRPARRGLPDPSVEEPVAGLRLQGRRRQGLRARRADDRRSPVRAVRDALRGRSGRIGRSGCAVPARPTAGPRPRLLHAVGVRVGRRARCHPTRRRRSTPAAGTTGSPRRSAASRRPGVGFAMGLDRVLLALEAEGAPLPPSARASMLRRRPRDGRRERRAGTWSPTFGPRASRRPGSYEDRPLKAQLKMADRAGARVRRDRRASRSWRTVRSRCDGWSTACRSRSRRRMWPGG